LWIGLVRNAILVLAARSPLTLSYMTQVLLDPDIHFFVHVDSKVDISNFTSLCCPPNTTFIESRKHVFWGGFEMVRAEVALLDHAFADPSFERFTLVSDDSFPLHSPVDLKDKLAVNVQRIGAGVVTSDLVRQRYTRFYYFDSDATNPQFRPPEGRCFSSRETADIADLAALLGRGKKPLPSYRQGSQWWSLTRAAVNHFLHIYRDDAHLRDSFRFSSVPDEHYIQTIIGAEGDRWGFTNSPMHTDFSKDPKPYVYKSVEELEPALASEHLFVRKVAADGALLKTLADIIGRNQQR
jgi:hypothetical protein